MNHAEATQFLKSFVNDVWVKRKIDEMDKYYSKNVKGYYGTTEVNYEDLKERLKYIIKHYAHSECKIEDIIASDDKIVFRSQYTLTQAESGKKILTRPIIIFHLSNDKIEAFWAAYDAPPYNIKVS